MSMRCPSCGSVFGDDAKFCPRDGARLLALRPASPPAAPAPPRNAPPGAPVYDGRTGIIPVAPRPGALPPDAALPGTTAFAPPPGRSTEQRESPGKAAERQRISHSNLVGQVLDGRYRIAKKIGEGGMSFVYLANDVSSNEQVAIKILSPSLAQDQNAMARLRREAGLGIRLEHPNICHIKRMGETEDGLVYVVMPYVEGELLADREHRLGVIPAREAARYVRDIAAGLHVAHQLKIIHRDLKPENVFIVGEGDKTRAVVMDFGLAKERRAGSELEKLTATGIILGTPEFMSPEQIRGKSLDGRTDIYSLALLTYEMLTGKLPFQGRTQQEMMINRLRADPTPLRRMRPDLEYPVALEKVLARGMEREADKRYQTAPEFADAVQAAVDGREPLTEIGLLGRLFNR
jgi:serine/threonine-protein kinase